MTRALVVLGVLLTASTAGAQTTPAIPVTEVAPSGEAVYMTRCAACHDSGAPRTPRREALREREGHRVPRGRCCCGGCSRRAGALPRAGAEAAGGGGAGGDPRAPGGRRRPAGGAR